MEVAREIEDFREIYPSIDYSFIKIASICCMVVAFWRTASNNLFFNCRFHFVREMSAALGFLLFNVYNFFIGDYLCHRICSTNLNNCTNISVYVARTGIIVAMMLTTIFRVSEMRTEFRANDDNILTMLLQKNGGSSEANKIALYENESDLE